MGLSILWVHMELLPNCAAVRRVTSLCYECSQKSGQLSAFVSVAERCFAWGHIPSWDNLHSIIHQWVEQNFSFLGPTQSELQFDFFLCPVLSVLLYSLPRTAATLGKAQFHDFCMQRVRVWWRLNSLEWHKKESRLYSYYIFCMFFLLEQTQV